MKNVNVKTLCWNLQLLIPYVDGHHYNGPLPENIVCESESVVQYSTLFMNKFNTRVKN